MPIQRDSLAVISTILLLLTLGCAKPKPVQPPPPPKIVKVPVEKRYPPQTVRQGDMPVYGCTVTKEEGNRADCICRKASSKLDVNDKTVNDLICK